jgi:hypothetical protein
MGIAANTTLLKRWRGNGDLKPTSFFSVVLHYLSVPEDDGTDGRGHTRDKELQKPMKQRFSGDNPSHRSRKIEFESRWGYMKNLATAGFFLCLGR